MELKNILIQMEVVFLIMLPRLGHRSVLVCFRGSFEDQRDYRL